jgi:hypothetical protein
MNGLGNEILNKLLMHDEDLRYKFEYIIKNNSRIFNDNMRMLIDGF